MPVSAAELLISVNADADGLRRGLNQAESTLRTAGRKMESAGKTLTAALTAPIVAVGAATVKAASDVEEMRSKMNVVFGDQVDDVEQWAGKIAEEVNRSADDIMGYATTLQDTFVPLGFAREDAAGLSKEVAQLAIDLASFNNEAERETVDLLTSALVGNHEAVRRFGVVLTQATVEQELLNMGIEGGIQQATGQEKALARLNIIMDNTKDAQGDAARTAGSFANELRGLQGSLREAGANIGELLLPHVTDAVEAFDDLIDRFNNLPQETQALVAAGATAAAALGPILWTAGKVVSALGTMGATMTGMVAAGGAVLAFAGGAAIIIDNWEAIKDFFGDFFKPIKEAVNNGLDAIKAAWADNKTLILGIVGAVISDAASIFESIKNIILPPLKGALGTLKSAWDEWGDNIVAAVGTAFSTIVGLIEAAGDIFVGAFQVLESIVNPSWKGIWEGIKGIVGGVFDAIITLIGGAARTMLNGIEAAFSWLPVIGPKIADAREAVSNFIDQRLKDEVDQDAKALESSVATAHEGAKGAVESAQSGIETAWGNINTKAAEIFGTGGGGGSATDAVVSGSNAMKDAIEGAGRVAAEDLVADFETAKPAFAEIESDAKSFEDQLRDDEQALNDMGVSSEDMAETVENSVKTLDTGGKSSQALEFFKGVIDDAAKAFEDGFNRAIKDSVKALLEGENAFTAAVNAAKQALINLAADGIAAVVTKLVKEGASGLVGAIGNAVKSLSGDGDSFSSAAKTAQSALSGSGGGGGLLGAITSTGGAIAVMLGGLEGVSRLMGGSFFKGMINGFKDLTDAVKNFNDEFQGFGGDEPRGGRQPGSGNFAGNSVAYALSQIQGINKTEASQLAPSFASLVDPMPIAEASAYGAAGIQGLIRDQWYIEAKSRAQNGAPALAKGGLIFGPTSAIMGEYPGARSNPEMVAPADKMMGYIEKAVQKAGGGGKQTINVYLDSRVLTRRVIRNMPSELNVMGVG